MSDAVENQQTNATHTDAMAVDPENRTEKQMLDAILRTSQIAREAGYEGEPLPDRQEAIPTPEGTDEHDQVPEGQDEQISTDVEQNPEGEDATATQEPDVYMLDDLEDVQITHKINGEDVTKPLSEWIKNSATNEALDGKGRELGDARKQLEAERNQKLAQIDGVLGAASQILVKAEEEASKEYHSFTSQIEEAREEGDQFKLSELKDKQELAQKRYWAAKNEREQMVTVAQNQRNELENTQWQQQLQHFSDNIETVIPDWSDEVATSVREFALKRGIPEAMINQMVDVNVIKFVDDFRRSEESRSTGAVKREAAPVRTIPVKRGQTPQEQTNAANQALTDKVMSGQATDAENDAFLRNMVSKHFE